MSQNFIMNSFYQTEDQYYDLGCDKINPDSPKVLVYRCRFLQKKMDIFGKKYYDFGVSLKKSKSNYKYFCESPACILFPFLWTSGLWGLGTKKCFFSIRNKITS